MRKLRAIILFVALAAWLGAPAFESQTAPPEIFKVEPPNWWINSRINPIQLLIYGRNLQKATASVDHQGVRVVEASPSERGTYLFVSLDIGQDARPGALNIRVQTPGGAASVAFDLDQLPRDGGRFQGFTPDDVIYLVMPDRFSDGDPTNNDPPKSRGMYSRANPRAYHGGDLRGIIKRLPYLKDLGITAIWITPVYDNADRPKDYPWGKDVSDYHGYGAIDFYQVEEHLGTMEDLKELVERAHSSGIKIILDQVINHTGPDHAWASDPPTPTWLNGTPENHLNNVYDIKSVTEEHPDPNRLEATLRGWFANILPDINQDDAKAARYQIQNSLWWIGLTGLDGVRLDTFPYVPRRFWSEWGAALELEFPRLRAVGEVFDGRPEVVSFFQGGRARFDGIDTHLYALFDFPSYFAIRDVFIRDQPMSKLADVLNADRLYPDPRALVTFLGNHDVPRFMSEPGASIKRLKLAFTYLLTARGTPQIYYGDEIGMKGGDDPDNRRDFPGGFPGDERNAFDKEGRTKRERKTFNHVRSLLRLRAAHPALRNGAMRILWANCCSLAFAREDGREMIIVAINNSDRPAKLEVPVGAASSGRATAWIEPLRARRAREFGGKVRIQLGPRDSIILLGSARQ